MRPTRNREKKMKSMIAAQMNISKSIRYIFVILLLALMPTISVVGQSKNGTSKKTEKLSPQKIILPMIDLILEGKYKEAALLEIQHSVNNKNVEEVTKKYRDEYSGKLKGHQRSTYSQKTKNSRDGRISLVTIYLIFDNGTETEIKYHFIEDENKFWKIVPEKTTIEWNKMQSKENSIENLGGGSYEPHLTEDVVKPTDFIDLNLSKDTVMILSFIIIVISIVMHIMRRGRDKDYGFGDGALTLFTILFLAICVLEIIITISGINPLWFCSPDRIGWFKSIIGLAVFIYVLSNQLKSFMTVMKDLTSTSSILGLRTRDYLTGIISGIIGFIAMCFYEYKLFTDAEATKNVFYMIVIATTVLQMIQAIIIYNKITTTKLITTFIYLIGILATIVAMIYFMVMIEVAIVTVIVWIVLLIMAQVQKSGRSGSYTSADNSEWNRVKDIPGELCRTCTRYPGSGRNCVYKGMVNDNTQACTYWQRG